MRLARPSPFASFASFPSFTAFAALCFVALGAGACATQEPPAMPSNAQLEHRASRDLGCPGRDVRVEVAASNAHAEVQGCGRRVLYAVTCTEGGHDCAWHPLDTP